MINLILAFVFILVSTLALFSKTIRATAETATTTTTHHDPPYCEDDYPIIIIGSGLAGHSAATQILNIIKENKKYNNTEFFNSFGNHPILILEKESKYGGNSMKATSGINGAITLFQQEQNIIDNINDFENDILYSAFANSNTNDINFNHLTSKDKLKQKLIKQLAKNSGNAVNWLYNTFNLGLTKITQCGGHSHPRTHRPPKGPAGNIIVKTIHTQLETEPNIEFRYNHKVIDLITDDETRSVIGVTVSITNPDTSDIRYETIYGSAIILTTGGYGNDHSNDGTSLLNKYSKNNENNLPTTNGNWATGDGIKLGKKIGGQLIDMSEIQIHPTGFINPKNKDDTTKFLAPEALRGSGGILININGNRFVNELDLRNNIVNKMKLQPNYKFYLILNFESANNFGSNIGFYEKFGLFKKYKNLNEFSIESDISYNNLKSTFIKYTESANENKKIKDEFGKIVFPVKIYDINEELYIAEITPVIHYTMGGLLLNENAQLLDINDEVIPGLFGAGEVTGGLHGKNRLAGNSLLECVVYGKIAGQSAIDYVKLSRKNKNLHGMSVENNDKTEL